jgi:SecD/SecF fusion protein
MDLTKLSKDQQQNPAVIQNQMVNILQNRASGSLGVTEPTVTAKGDDQIIVELPEFTDIQKAEDVIGESARIEYYWAKNVTTEMPNGQNRPYAPVPSEDPNHVEVDFTTKIGGKLITPKDPAHPGMLNPDYENIIKGWDLILAGDDLTKAEPSSTGSNYIPLLHFGPAAAARLETWCRQHYNQKENLAAVLDGVVLNIAPLKDGAILSDNAAIEGTFPDGYVAKLCDLLNSGALPVDLKNLGAEKVSATIGSQALGRMVQAGVIAFGVISLFLIGYYSFPGFVAFLALSLYVLFTLTVLKLINATFSLAGIAGFILSVGMAVDANILVFERFKEEMKAGRPLHTAIDLGFRRALSAIFDSNACTVITSLVLVQLGTGPVKGFATTLIIGVVISLFTAVTVTRSLLMFFVDSGIATNQKWYAVQRNWFSKADKGEPLHVVNKATRWFAISGVTILICVPFFFMNGFRLNVEFKGGYEATYSLQGSNLSSGQISENLDRAGLRGGNVQIGEVGATKTEPAHRLAIISLPPQPLLSGTDTANLAKIAQSAGITADPNAEFQKIGPALQAETRNNAILGVIISSALIIVYLAIRFGAGFGGFVAGMRFGVSAIGALIHDILVVFGTAAVVGFAFGWEVSALFLTAMLTIIGFSVHDTIVIFDRIRENLRRSKKTETFENLVNRSITQSFARSINTSGTVIVTLLILVFFGTTTNELKFFVTSMLIGIISGTYSSIYNASPILFLWDKAVTARHPESSLVAMAASEAAKLRLLQPHGTVSAATTVGPEVPPTPTTGSGGRTYGQVRRRASAAKPVDLDEDI